MKIKLGVAVASVALLVAIYDGNAQSVNQNQVQDQPIMCNMPGMSGMSEHDHQAMMANKGGVAMGQQDQEPNPPQPGDTPTHRKSPGDGCSSVDPNAKPGAEFNGVKKNTVGCICVRKCINGQTLEDLSRDEKGVYICKNACNKDRCSCPDPCKS